MLVLVVAAFVGWLWWRSAYSAGQAEHGGFDLFEPPAGLESEAPPAVPRPAAPTVPVARAPGGGTLPGTANPPSNTAPVGGPAPIPPATSAPVIVNVPTVPSPSSPEWTNRTVTVFSNVVANADMVVAAQLALARRGISSGAIDGVVGTQTRSALRIFQREEKLPVSGDLDAVTFARLGADRWPYTNYVVTTEDLGRLRPVPRTWLGKSEQERLDYESLLELVAERSHAHPRLIRQLNPGIDWDRVPPQTVLKVPDASLPPPVTRAAEVRISLSERTLRAYDARGNLLVQFPCSIARRVEKRPIGELKVVKLASLPNYRFDPQIFPESPEARRIGRKLMIPSGPNNPVGTAWIGLDRPGYGIHGTPSPEEVGRTESHGCFRLANWNAEYLLKVAWVGMPVRVEP